MSSSTSAPSSARADALPSIQNVPTWFNISEAVPTPTIADILVKNEHGWTNIVGKHGHYSAKPVRSCDSEFVQREAVIKTMGVSLPSTAKAFERTRALCDTRGWTNLLAPHVQSAGPDAFKTGATYGVVTGLIFGLDSGKPGDTDCATPAQLGVAATSNLQA